MNAVEFRKRLESVVGEGQYRRLVNSLNQGDRWLGRFRFWQEALLAEAGVTAPSPAELYWPDRIGFAGRCRGAVSDYSIAQGRSFPNTDCGPLRPGNRFDNVRRGVWYCHECRAAEANWRERTA